MKGLKEYQEKVEKINALVFDPDYLMPPCIFIPRLMTYNLDLSAEDNNGNLALSLFKQTSDHDLVSLKDMKSKSLFLNPFFTLLKVSALPQKPSNLGDDDSEESDNDKE